MTVRRRLICMIAATACLFPACISISARPAPITPPELAARITAEGAARATESISTGRTDFAVYPSRPGEVVPTRPVARETTVARAPAPMPIPPGPPSPAGPVEPPSPLVHAGGPGSNAPGESGIYPLAAIRPTPSESPLLAALRAHLDNKPERAFKAIADLDRLNQDVVLAMLPVLTRSASANLAGDSIAAAMLVDQMRAAAARLEPLAALRVEAALFCDEVWGFGRYRPRPINQPYRPNDQAQLYLEERNLVSQPTVGPRGETYLTQVRVRAEVLDAYNNRVDLPSPEDYRRRVKVLQYVEKRYTRAPIQDFHHVIVFPTPPTPGVYTVHVEVSDAAGRRTAKIAPVEFRVAGP